jgi:small nuclear ribonucleoprotein (snRNP)-like protein
MSLVLFFLLFFKKNVIYSLLFQVLIHLLDDTTQKGTLINYHKHYNIALFEVDMNMSTKLPPVSTELVDYGQEVFLIGRDEDLNLNASHGRVQCIDPGYYDHYHYMYLECESAKVLM